MVLDVRGLEPPEPIVLTLEALERLPPGAALVQLNVGVPQFLLTLLDERGYDCAVEHEDADLVRVRITRQGPASLCAPVSPERITG